MNEETRHVASARQARRCRNIGRGDAAKQKLVDAIRMLERAEIIDHNGHCSIRRDAGSLYINSGASVRGALTLEDIVGIDLDGNLVEGAAKPPLEFHIHSEIYRARPDVNAVFHTHPRWSTFLTMTGHAYKPVYAQGVLLGDMPVMDSPLSVNTKPMGEKLAASARARGRRRSSRRTASSWSARTSSNASPSPPMWRRTPTGNTWPCRSASPTSSARRSRRRAAKSSGRRTSSRRPGTIIIRNFLSHRSRVSPRSNK